MYKVILLIIFIIVGCSPDNIDSHNNYNIRKETNHTSVVSRKKVVGIYKNNIEDVNEYSQTSANKIEFNNSDSKVFDYEMDINIIQEVENEETIIDENQNVEEVELVPINKPENEILEEENDEDNTINTEKNKDNEAMVPIQKPKIELEDEIREE